MASTSTFGLSDIPEESQTSKCDFNAVIDYHHTLYLQSKYKLLKKKSQIKAEEKKMKQCLDALIDINRMEVNVLIDKKLELMKLQHDTDLQDQLDLQLTPIKDKPVIEVMKSMTSLATHLDEKRHQIKITNLAKVSLSDMDDITTAIKSLEALSQIYDENLPKAFTETCDRTTLRSKEIATLKECQYLGNAAEEIGINKMTLEIEEIMSKGCAC